jgi:ethanolamine ammonia-lyase large subunit
MENVKFKAQQAKQVYRFNNIKESLHKANASVWYNKMCG